MNRFVVILILIQIIASERIPQGDLEVLLGLPLSKFSLLYTLLDKVLQPAEHLSKVARHTIIKGFQCLNILHREKGSGFRVNFWFFFLLPQTDSSYIPTEYVEATPGQIDFSEEVPSRIQYSGQIPGDEVQISIVQSGSTAQEGYCVLTSVFLDSLL